MIQKLFGFSESLNNYHDLFDRNANQRIEVKFSIVRRKWKNKITSDNILSCIEEAVVGNPVMRFIDRHNHKYDCNINQVKPAEFDVLYYGLFFADGVLIFKINSEDIGPNIFFSDKQHKGNVGEGQFHINNNTLSVHMKNHFRMALSYEKLYSLF